MSKNSSKGYVAERAIEVLLQQRYPRLAENILRPRAGAMRDKGDIHGLPVVISVKNWVEPTLGPWVDQMNTMCGWAGKGVGVVWHKRRGKSDPKEWWVTTDTMSYDLLRDKTTATVYENHAGIMLSTSKLTGWMRLVEEARQRQGYEVGVLHHNRKNGGGKPFVTMLGGSFLRLLDDYTIGRR